MRTIDLLEQPKIETMVNGTRRVISTSDIEYFLKQCESFMQTDHSGFETMIQIITDNIIDGATPGMTIEELRPQLKFLREVGFLLKNIVVQGEN